MKVLTEEEMIEILNTYYKYARSSARHVTVRNDYEWLQHITKLRVNMVENERTLRGNQRRNQ